MSKDLPQVEGRYVLLKVGKKFDSRRLRDALKKCLSYTPLNGEERIPIVSMLAQIEIHLEKQRKDS